MLTTMLQAGSHSRVPGELRRPVQARAWHAWRRRRGWQWFDTYDGGEWRRAR